CAGRATASGSNGDPIAMKSKYTNKSASQGLHLPCSPQSQMDNDRRGSVLLVVIGLLSLLLLAGIAFYTFASQENSSAEYYADAADVGNPLKLSADELFEFGLEQLIIGPNSSFTMSALQGGRAAPGSIVAQLGPNPLQIELPGRHSLLAGVIGSDTSVYNGLGINLATDTTAMGTLAGAYGYPYVDQDQDGTPDNPALLSQINFSASANGGASPTVPMLPAPDTGFTAPDINSPYLAYIGSGTDNASGFGPANDHRVIIPTFHRPQYLRGGVGAMTTLGNGNGPRLFRPHPDNKCPNGSSRFLNASISHPTVAGHTVTAFPFSANPGGGSAISQGVWDLSGPPGASPSYFYNWDVDGDGDGTREGVWLDLDYPIQDLADGRSFVPLFSFTVVDSDGLINLNASGNTVAWVPPGSGNPTSPPIAYPGTYTNYIHRSNMGQSRTEINPLWGLFADGSVDPSSNPVYFNSIAERDAALTQMRVFWQLPSGAMAYPATNISRLDTANMDFLSLLTGRVDFAPGKNPGPGTYSVDGNYYAASGFFPGRRGETSLLSGTIAPVGGSLTTIAPGAIPLPGAMGFDDDNDTYATAAMVHPIDYLGLGSSYTVGAGSAVTQMLLGRADNANNPCRWPAYNGYHNLQYSSGGSSTSYIVANAGSSFLNQLTTMTDEEDEEIVDTAALPPAAINSRDSMFGVEEMFGLHGSNTDYNATSSSSRLRSLAHFNFADNKLSETIRKQYTVMSMDRLQFGLGANARRVNEVNADLDSDGIFEFPPAALSSNCSSAAEPIRLPLRQYLKVEYGSKQLNSASGFRLNMNKLVWTTNPGNPLAGQTYLRDLTYHPNDPGANDVYSTYTLGPTAYPPTPGDLTAQEWWARHDRQLLARDIYCLLYILGGGSDSAIYQDAQPVGATPTPDSNAARGLYSDSQLKEMAQFAVNYVDALDVDDNITMFEYDRDLGDGWNLGDDPYQTGDDNVGGAIGGNDRGVVYGVETQSLTLSEGLVIHTPQLVSDQVGATTFNDTTERWYTAIELRNASPFDVDLTAKSWRIRVIDQALDQQPPLAPTIPSPERYLTFKSGLIGHGNNFLIGSRTGSDLDKDGNARPSNFRVNINHEAETAGSYSFEAIVPAAISSTIVPTPSAVVATDAIADPGTQFDLDLVHASSAGKFDLYNDSTSVTVTPTGDFVNSGGGGTVVRFAIERRLHLTRSSLASTTDNPWIEVDRMDAPVKEFSITAGMTGAMLQSMVLPNLISKERAQPFSRTSEGNNVPIAATPYIANSVGKDVNSNTTSAFSNWQPHFNRPYTSAMDLLTLPLFGPTNFTKQFGLGIDWTTNTNWGTTPNFAQERFLRTIDSANIQNRWYRLLGLIGVPTHSQTSVVRAPYALRTPGMINLNTMRDRGVFNGLVDDASTQFANGALDASTPNTLIGHLNPYFNSQDPRTMALDLASDYTGAQRDWWAEFLAARDQQDPITQLYLPGMAHSRPYRSPTYSDSGPTSIEYTLLRGMVRDGTAVSRRGVFEASRNLNAATDTVDLHTRHRLLRKVSNNSTTRSNVFSVWVSVGLFEAVQLANNDVQIGGPLNGTGVPTFRGFFVVDRSLPEQGLDKLTGQFDFQQFIKYRKTIR
ncbi:MAG: hypothetical protein JWN70_5516, partial [Planctomycetaceae bacterium]|nr:hypothetical protein [Planctomycetaceae bacterium]